MKIETAPFFSTGGLPSLGVLGDYARDSWQRIVLYADVMRRRGNQYQEHLAEEVPNVLDFPAELVMSGLELARPVNYGLARILTPDAPEPDPGKRPFVVVDPRAGHGPGIGGFKAESEIGVALRAGHPCYFVGFLPDPVPGQTVEDVMHAEAAFLEKVIALHPLSEGKPVVIGNCQAGWQILMTAAMRPELFGPIIVAGAPVSYWAGWHGRNPMRYAGGLMGGSWATALAGDMGKGRFDGASLVQNFEKLNPANTLWGKQYNLYANIDTEAPRYLEFEKYWGGHVFLNDVEMQYIVDNLFIGNRLATAELITSDGVRLDLRNIRSPIVVFCSNGDNITPPPQALGWITDLYRDDNDVLLHDQTIVYAVHDSIGHLGIFVSAKVGHKEHQKFASNIDLINLLPAGIYEARIVDKTPDTPNADLASGDYVLQVEHRGIEDVRAIVLPSVENDRKFAAAARVSEVNLALYRTFAQPWVRAMVTPQSARFLQLTHPLRVSYERWTDHNPLAKLVAKEAEKVRAHRQPGAGQPVAGHAGGLLRRHHGRLEQLARLARYGAGNDLRPGVRFTPGAGADGTSHRRHLAAAPASRYLARALRIRALRNAQDGRGHAAWGPGGSGRARAVLHLPLPHDRRRAQGQPGPQIGQAAVHAGLQHGRIPRHRAPAGAFDAA